MIKLSFDDYVSYSCATTEIVLCNHQVEFIQATSYKMGSATHVVAILEAIYKALVATFVWVVNTL